MLAALHNSSPLLLVLPIPVCSFKSKNCCNYVKIVKIHFIICQWKISRTPPLLSLCPFYENTAVILGNRHVFGRVVISVHLLRFTTYVGANKELFNEHICYLNTSDVCKKLFTLYVVKYKRYANTFFSWVDCLQKC